VAVMVLVQLPARKLPWGYTRFALNPAALKKITGLRFGKMLGSGYNGGFGLRPSFDRQAMFMVFADEQSAQNALHKSSLLQQYKDCASEFFSVLLDPYAVKGSWSNQFLIPTVPTPAAEAPIAALTRASIRSSQLVSFWRDAAPAHQDIALAKGCQLAAGVGELPVVRQATFTLWDNLDAMNNYARRGAHMTAIAHSAQRNYFTESMFVRFVARQAQGVYKGLQYGK
jgi:hypothetical protein